MQKITNDRELRSALNRLSIEDQRAIGLLFVASIKLPEMDSGLKQALEMALDSDCGGHEREMAYKTAKSVATRTYTACGRDTDWEIQAEHFIAAACSAAQTGSRCVLPAPRARACCARCPRPTASSCCPPTAPACSPATPSSFNPSTA